MGQIFGLGARGGVLVGSRALIRPVKAFGYLEGIIGHFGQSRSNLDQNGQIWAPGGSNLAPEMEVFLAIFSKFFVKNWSKNGVGFGHFLGRNGLYFWRDSEARAGVLTKGHQDPKFRVAR